MTPTLEPVRARNPVRVLMTSTSYPSGPEDWRGVFIRHLAESLARRDDLRLSLWAPPGPCAGPVHRVSTPDEERRLHLLMERGGIAHLLRTERLKGLVSAMHLLRDLHAVYRRSNVDLYHVNWLQSAIPVPSNGRPLLVSVLGSDMQFLRIPAVKSLLRRAFHGRPVAICPNAGWMQGELERLFGDRATIRPVPFGIDPCWFDIVRDRDGERTPQWLAVTRLTRGKLGPLIEWCEPLFAGKARVLHLIGPMQESIALPDWIRYHGPAAPEDLCREWFPRATGLITLSRHAEGRPQVMLEAMAAGLPIVASRLPAHEGLVEDGRTGYLVDSAEQLASSLERVEVPDTGVRLGAQAREKVRRTPGTWDDAADRFQVLYRHLLEEQDS